MDNDNSVINDYKQRIQRLENENRLLKERLEKAGIPYNLNCNQNCAIQKSIKEILGDVQVPEYFFLSLC